MFIVNYSIIRSIFKHFLHLKHTISLCYYVEIQDIFIKLYKCFLFLAIRELNVKATHNYITYQDIMGTAFKNGLSKFGAMYAIYEGNANGFGVT